MKTPTYTEIKPYIDEGLISMCPHPEDEKICIFNYTQVCQFAGKWDDITRQCRGLIMNIETGEVLARPFPKFFNYQEHVAKGWEIPSETPVVTEKLDGSLGILYALNGKPWIATRGSFVSDQAKWATDWWRKNVNAMPEPFVTHLFEIIYPENRIVVNYDFSGLVWLGALSNDNGKRYMVSSSWWDKIRCVNYHHQLWDSLDQLASMDVPNAEGFVCYFPEANVRIKMKFPEYVRLHKIITGVSEIGIWEMLRDGKSLDELIEKVPDEFFKWVKETAEKLEGQFEAIRKEVLYDFEDMIAWSGGHKVYEANMEDLNVEETRERRKPIAKFFSTKKYPSLLFAMFDGKDDAELIWRMIRPHGQKVFKTDADQ